VFPILWTLDPLSLGFNFCPFPPVSPPGQTFPPRARLSSRGSSHSLFVASDLSVVFRRPMHATMLPVLVAAGRQGGAQCDSNQEPRPCQRDLRVSSQLFPSPFPLPRLFPSLSLYSGPIERCVLQCRVRVGQELNPPSLLPVLFATQRAILRPKGVMIARESMRG